MSKAAIKVFTRPRNSGSEEVLRELVMKDLEPAIFPESGIGGMARVFGEILGNRNAICYTFNNYKDWAATQPRLGKGKSGEKGYAAFPPFVYLRYSTLRVLPTKVGLRSSPVLVRGVSGG